MLNSSEQYLHLFLVKNLNLSTSGSSKTFPKLLYCWKSCLEILDAVVGLRNPDDNRQTAHFFLHPASVFYLDGKVPQDYTDRVKNPMDFGTITSNLIEGTYQTVDAFVKDCKLVSSNCKAYHQDPEAEYVIQASRLEEFLSQKLDNLLQFDKSGKGVEARKMASSPAVLALLKPPNAFYTSMLDELRSSNYKDKSTNVRLHKWGIYNYSIVPLFAVFAHFCLFVCFLFFLPYSSRRKQHFSLSIQLTFLHSKTTSNLWIPRWTSKQLKVML